MVQKKNISLNLLFDCERIRDSMDREKELMVLDLLRLVRKERDEVIWYVLV